MAMGVDNYFWPFCVATALLMYSWLPQKWRWRSKVGLYVRKEGRG